MTDSRKLLSLEGLRGLAAMIVVVSHLRLTFFPEWTQMVLTGIPGLPVLPGRVLGAALLGIHNGTLAVWVFWVMSGFVLSWQYFSRARQGGDAVGYLQDAALRRYPRLLLPVLVSVLFAYVLLALGMMHHVEVAAFLKDPEGARWLAAWYPFPADLGKAVYTAMWESFFAYDRTTTYNSVLWTMEKEMYGSLFVFAVLACTGGWSWRGAVYVLLGAALGAAGLHWLNAFLVGVVWCDLKVNGDRTAAGRRLLASARWQRACGSPWLAAVLFGGLLVMAGLWNYRGILFLVLASLVVGLTLLSKPAQRVLSSPLMTFLGRISFGVYLVHFTLICSFASWAYLALQPRLGHADAAGVSSVATWGLSLVIGYGLYVLADRPAIAFSRAFSKRVREAFARQGPGPDRPSGKDQRNDET